MARRSKNQKKHRIFVVEDDRVTRKLITRCLDEAGYQSVECPEGKDAIHAAEMWPPTAMLVDVMLPDCQGNDVVQEILEDPRCNGIKVIFLTGILANKPQDGNYYFDIDGVRYPALRKPINFKQLLELLAERVAEAEDEEQRRIEKQEKARREASLAKAAAKEADSEKEAQSGWGSGDSLGLGDLEYRRGSR